MTEAEIQFMHEFVAERHWTFAKTMAANPHWYTVRKWKLEPADQDAFDCFVQLIRCYGFDRPFQGKPYRGLDFEGFYYWTMGAPVPETIVINRKPIQSAGGRQGALLMRPE